ncbi:MAG: hypothetical protein N3F63_07495 [Thermoplasmata archaeon]|nr:hypothetical protein [Thermoplasmata archaeon]
MELQFENNGHLRCVHCNQTLKRNKKLNFTFCQRCGLTHFHVDPPHHTIISTEK